MRNGEVTVYDKEGNIIRGIPDMPAAYIQGWIEFYKLKFKVTSDVLIPRPETELLVDEVLKYTGVIPMKMGIQNSAKPDSGFPIRSGMTILDIGTGSGAIAISIAKNNPKIKLFATDISPEALAVARQNAKFHRMDKRIIFLESDLLEKISSLEKVDVIVTNLPYIPNSRIPYLDPSVKDFEPKLALEGGHDGFDLYRRLFDQMVIKKTTPKLLIGEIDETQEKIALLEVKKYFPKAKAEVKLDLAKKPRILIINF